MKKNVPEAGSVGNTFVEKGPSRMLADPTSNTSQRLAWRRENRQPDRPYDDPGKTLWTAPRGKGLRVRLFANPKGFFELRIERRVDGAWLWTEKGCSFQANERQAIIDALMGAS